MEEAKRKYYMLDLFSGLCGASSAMLEDDNWEVITVDVLEKFEPSICNDILNLTPQIFKGKNFDLIWASPPCNAFSMASVSSYWTKVNEVYLPKREKTIYFLNLIYHTLWLINELKPRYWFLENPRGMLHKFIGKPSGWITYCQYGENRMKPTNLWGIHPYSFKYKHCSYNAKCHIAAPRGSKTGTQGLKDSETRSKIPYLLSLSVKESVEFDIKQIIETVRKQECCVGKLDNFL